MPNQIDPPKTTPAVVAKKSYRGGHVTVRVKLTARSFGGDTVQVSGGAELTTAQARALAASLVEQADAADAKCAAEAARKERRAKYRDREIAAGRMVVFGRL